MHLPAQGQRVTAGGYHTMLIKADGTLWASGANLNGALGDGTFVDRSAPVPVDLTTNWQSVSAAGDYTVAIRTDGTL